jgi:EAL domain-containing protein (putative c-di-GMP-specific phosphodiesterase class I)/DNA-binding response OmpR family regulator
VGQTNVGGNHRAHHPVLIVDDDRSMRRLIAAALELAGHRTAEAEGGPEALELIRHHRFAAVLLDSRMPEMSGLDVLVAIRARTEDRTLPVILVTGDDEVADRVRGLQAGADDYVIKPFHPDELVARVEAQLRGHAAWMETVERRLRERAAVAAALFRLGPEVAPEATAETICAELRALRGLAGAAVVAFPGDAVALPLAVQGASGWDLRPDEPLPVPLARYLQGRASNGPWIEEPYGAASSVASARPAQTVTCAPLQTEREQFGLLLLVPDGPDAEPDGDVRSALSAAIDFASVVSELLDPATMRWEYRQRRMQLEEVLERRAFSPVFQPIVELRGARVIGFEALTRFHDGTPPDRRFAEAAVFDRRLDLETATMRAALLATRTLPRSAWVSVNVSPSLLLAPDLLLEAVDSAGRPVVLELTEHDRIDDYDGVRAAVSRMGDGVRLSVDDAGSGFASLRHVLALEPQYVKLDQTWVSRIHHDPARQALVAGLGHFARHTGATLIAEGIESSAELDVLRDLSVDLGQGFFFGRPEPAPAAR